MTVSVFYLCRFQDTEILHRTERFLRSYLRYPDTTPHKLCIGLKGWKDQSEVRAMVRHLGVECEFLSLPDKGFDWTSFFAFSYVANTRYVCFLNSHSEILSNRWLSRLMEGVTEGPCLVGNTASLSKINRLPRPNRHLIKCPWILFYIVFSVLFRGKHLDHEPVEGHIRSNAFLIERLLFKEFSESRFCPINKAGAHELESGRLGLTWFVTKEKGGTAVIVNDSDRVYYERDWFEAHTFRVNQQEKLLVADNQTRFFERQRWYRKCIMTFMTWRRL
jgi:hypothetical protein